MSGAGLAVAIRLIICSFFLTMFLARVLTQVTSKDEEKIEEFTAIFGKLQQSLDNRLAVYTACASTKILEIVLDSGVFMFLNTIFANVDIATQRKQISSKPLIP
jgi:peptidoglycan hydrolase CwlO-like protein